jgi:hypothetical protein
VGNALRKLLALSVVAGVLPVAVGNATPAATTTYSCAQVWGSFNIQLVGDRDWGWNLGGLGNVGVPKERAVIVVWSLGGKLPGGLNVYGWTTAKLSRPSPKCSVVKTQLKEPSLSGLGPVTRVKDGWAFGRKFGCLETGRVLITLSEVGGKAKMVVRLQKSGRVMAVGELANGGGWIRGSKTCEAKEK